MKIRVILDTDLQTEIDKAVALQLSANPEYELDSVNVNPVKIDHSTRKGVVELDVMLKHKKADPVAEAVKLAIVQKNSELSQKDAIISDLNSEILKLKDEKRTLREELKNAGKQEKTA